MATFGKISSSLLNFNSTTTTIDIPGYGITPSQQQTIPQRHGPSLNLGLFQSTPYVLTPADTDSNTLSDGYQNNISFGNNITLVTPNTKPSQPNNASPEQRVARYEGSFMDTARSLHGSIIIGHDIATIGFPAGSNADSAGYYPARGYFRSPNTVIGSFILEGLGSQTSIGGYGQGRMGGNCIVGNGFGSAVVNSNLDYDVGGYGYGALEGALNNSVVGHNNYQYSMRPQVSGYSARITNNAICGTNNGVHPFGQYDFNKGYYTGQNKTQVISERDVNNAFRRYVYGNTVMGTQNNTWRFNWASAPVQPTNPQETTQISESANVVIGRENNTYELENYDYAGGNVSADRVRFSSNVVIGEDNDLRRDFSTPGGYFTNNSDRNVLIGKNNELASDSSRNTVIGNDWTFESVAPSDFSEARDNVLIGRLSDTTVLGPSGGVGIFNTSNNVFIGHDINNGLPFGTRARHQNCVLLGAFATASSATATNEITLGGNSIAALRCNVTTITALSDARDKTNIEPISNASAFIKDLKPVKFDWNRRDGAKSRDHDMGFLAQDLDDAQNKHGIQDHLDIVYKSNPEALEASYGKLLPILVQALKEQQEEIEKLKSTTN